MKPLQLTRLYASQVSVIQDLNFSLQHTEPQPDEKGSVEGKKAQQTGPQSSWCRGGVLSTAARSRGVCCAGASTCGGGVTCSGLGTDPVCRRGSANDSTTKDNCCVGEHTGAPAAETGLTEGKGVSLQD